MFRGLRRQCSDTTDWQLWRKDWRLVWMVDGGKGGLREVSDGSLIFNVIMITTPMAVCGGNVEENCLVRRYGRGGFDGSQ